MIFTLIAIGLTFLVLIIGVVCMAVGGKLNKKLSSKLMSIRVAFQALSILIVGIIYFLSKKTGN